MWPKALQHPDPTFVSSDISSLSCSQHSSHTGCLFFAPQCLIHLGLLTRCLLCVDHYFPALCLSGFQSFSSQPYCNMKKFPDQNLNRFQLFPFLLTLLYFPDSTATIHIHYLSSYFVACFSPLRGSTVQQLIVLVRFKSQFYHVPDM